MTIGEMLRSFLTKLEWFSTLFPRIPVPVQKTIDQQIKSRPRKIKKDGKEGMEEIDRHVERRRSRSYACYFENQHWNVDIEWLTTRNVSFFSMNEMSFRATAQSLWMLMAKIRWYSICRILGIQDYTSHTQPIFKLESKEIPSGFKSVFLTEYPFF